MSSIFSRFAFFAAPLAVVAATVPLSLSACSSTPAASDAGTDASATDDARSSNDASTSGDSSVPLDATPTPDAGTKPVRCTDAELEAADFTKFGGVDVSFFGASPGQYTNHCAKTKVGDTVTFASDFTMHPLVPNGGDSPSFIPATNTGATVEAIPTKPGVYGFECSAHPGLMFGAIKVVAK